MVEMWVSCTLIHQKEKKKNYFLAGKRGPGSGMRGNCELW